MNTIDYTSVSTDISKSRDDNKRAFIIQSLQSANQKYKLRKTLYNNKDFYHIIWVLKGSGKQLIDVNNFDLKEKHMYFILPNQIQTIEDQVGLEGYIISFTYDFPGLSLDEFHNIFFCGKPQYFDGQSVLEISQELRNEILPIVLKMKKEFYGSSSLRLEVLGAYFKLFLIFINRHISSFNQIGNQSIRAELANNFFTLLNKSDNSKKKVAEYADMLAVSPNYLNNVVKKVSGYPVSYHIKHQVLLEAKKQAMYTNKSMKEIAYQLGFEEKSHFSKFFKKNEGNCFSIYRKSIKRKISK